MGIDIGTFESKGVLTDETGAVVARLSCGHEMESPRPGYAEHDAEATWWAGFCRLSHGLIEQSKTDPAAIRAVCCSTIAPCCLPVDAACRPLRKAILYGVDVRALEEIRYLEDQLGQEQILQACGTPLTAQSAAAKILWIRNHEPDIYQAAARFVTGTTFLVARLTGAYVIDRYTAASWVPLYDPHSQDWGAADPALFCRPDQLAECRWTAEIAGTVTRQAASETGLAVGTPVAIGTADAAAEAISAGVRAPGDMLLMYGSSIFIIHVTDRWRPDRRIWTAPYLFPDTYVVSAGMSTAGTLTRWFRDNLARDLVQGQAAGAGNAYDLLAEETRDLPPGSAGLIVLPYLSGERTPINDPQAKGMIFGLNLCHTRAHLFQACLEGVGYGIAQHFALFDEMGLDTRKVMAVGGGTKSERWLQIVSDISGKTQQTVAEGIGAAYGDALLAALSVGHYRSVQDFDSIIRSQRTIKPDLAVHRQYEPYRSRFARLYEATRDLMHED
jgi:xylulokinase